MLKKTLLFIFFLGGLASCSCSYQYNVMVINSTSGDLTIEYKTDNDIRGKVEEKITLKKGENKRIIKSVDLKIDDYCDGTTAGHHNHVAEYIRAYQNGNGLSKITWYDGNQIRFEKTDIEQAEFYIEYTDNDF